MHVGGRTDRKNLFNYNKDMQASRLNNARDPMSLTKLRDQKGTAYRVQVSPPQKYKL